MMPGCPRGFHEGYAIVLTGRFIRARADGFLRRMGAGSGRRQHRKSVYRRVYRHSVEPRVVVAVGGLGSFLSDLARVAVQAARCDVHLAWAVASADLEGSGPGDASDHRLARRVAALH